MEKTADQFTKYEVARIIGARALQLAMDAPLLMKVSDEELKKINYSVLKLAEMEFNSGVLPITVNRPLPKKIYGKLKTSGEEEAEIKEKERIKKEKEAELAKEKKEEIIEKKEMEQVEGSEIMELAIPEDEVEEEAATEEEVIDEEGI